MTDGFHLADGVLTVESGVRYLKNQCFAENDEIVKVVLPGTVGFMEEEVFAGCENLSEAVLPEGLVNIGVAAFTACSKLKRVVIPSSVRTVDEGAFLFCDGLESVALPKGLEEIRSLAFQSTGLREIVIPESVREIGEEAFFECERLRRADVLGRDTIIGPNAFGSDYSLTEGFIAPGYPPHSDAPAELLYSLLWASSRERHSKEVSERAERFISGNIPLVMERILKYNNVPAMNGIAEAGLFRGVDVDCYVRAALDAGLTEITALLLKAKGSERNIGEEFDI